MTRPSMPFGGHRSSSNDMQQAHRPMRAGTAPNTSASPAGHLPVTLSFNVPFSSELAGPKRDEVIYASQHAIDRWIQPEGSEDKAIYDLPVHVQHRDSLEMLCEQIVQRTSGGIRYFIRSGHPKPVAGMPPRSKAWVTNVCLRGLYDVVQGARQAILNSTPISLVCGWSCCWAYSTEANTS
jgi:hypothetical protein